MPWPATNDEWSSVYQLLNSSSSSLRIMLLLIPDKTLSLWYMYHGLSTPFLTVTGQLMFTTTCVRSCTSTLHLPCYTKGICTTSPIFMFLALCLTHVMNFFADLSMFTAAFFHLAQHFGRHMNCCYQYYCTLHLQTNSGLCKKLINSSSWNLMNVPKVFFQGPHHLSLEE